MTVERLENKYVALPTTVLSLCAGGGGLDLGLRLAVPDARTVCYVENEVTACGILAARMEDGGLDDAPIWTDLRTFGGTPWRSKVSWVIGGYPCQPFSNAGKRLGAEDPRHLWPDVQRIVSEVQPEFCFFENVGAHLRLGFYEVARSLQGMGYRVAATLLTASEVGAPHGRERLFILAHRDQQHDDWGGYAGEGRRAEPANSSVTVADAGSSGRNGRSRDEGRESVGRASVAGAGAAVGDSTRQGGRGIHVRRGRQDKASGIPDGAERSVGHADGLGRRQEGHGSEPPELAHQAVRPMDWPPGPSDTDAWRRVLAVRPDLAPAIEPGFRLLADGMARGLGRSDQLHILGNGVVPEQAAYALNLLMASR